EESEFTIRTTIRATTPTAPKRTKRRWVIGSSLSCQTATTYLEPHDVRRYRPVGDDIGEDGVGLRHRPPPPIGVAPPRRRRPVPARPPPPASSPTSGWRAAPRRGL